MNLKNKINIELVLKKYDEKPIYIDFNIKKNKKNNFFNKYKIVGLDWQNNIKYFDYFYENVKDDLSIKINLPLYPNYLSIVIYTNDTINEYDVDYFIYESNDSYENLIINNDLKDFIKLAYDFCRSFTLLKTDEVYYSDNLKVGIFYIEKHHEYNSPMFINCYNRLIYVQKRMIINLTVNEIINMLLHEYSHCFLNKNSNSEIESDYNAINNYIKLNFSPYHSLKMINGVIKRNDTISNRVRRLLYKNLLFKKYKNKR